MTEFCALQPQLSQATAQAHAKRPATLDAISAAPRPENFNATLLTNLRSLIVYLLFEPTGCETRAFEA